MKRIFNYTATKQDEGKTLLSFLKNRNYTRGVIIHLKKTPSSILVNGVWEHVTRRLCTGDEIQILLVESQSSALIQPSKLPLSILYEDEDLMVIDKPSGMPVHPSLNHYDNTLANAVAGYFQEQGIPFVFRCVNRLDRDTSGLTIIAKHMLSSAILNLAMKEGKISRTYYAIVEGDPGQSGTITAPIARVSDSVIERTTDSKTGIPAVTHFQSVITKNGFSLISLQLETGRTHQIRVHMRHIGHPLLGDFLYNPECNKMNRQALHARKLSFPHPMTGEAMCFVSPWPDDFVLTP